jgi:hypothetical protein
LVLDGLATATPGTVHAGGRPIKVTWLTITDLGRQTLAGHVAVRAVAQENAATEKASFRLPQDS